MAHMDLGSFLDENDSFSRMSLGDHLDELRTRIVRTLIGVVVAAVIMLIFGRGLVLFLCQPLVQIQRLLGLEPQTYSFAPTTAFTIYLKVSLVAALIIASPWVVYQAWRFIAAGLYQHERKVVYVLAPFSTVMTLLGASFAYFIMLPVTLLFLVGFANSYPPIDVGDSQTMPWTYRILAQAMPSQQRHINLSPTHAHTTETHGTDETAGPDANPATDTDRNPDNPDQHNAHASPRNDRTPRPDPAHVHAPLPMGLPVLAQDPAAPREGDAWLKTPENQLRLFLNGQIRRINLAGRSLMSPMIEVTHYINFVLMLTLAAVVAFQVPVVMMVLGYSGLVTPAMIKPYRRHAIFICFALGMILTPADIASMLLMALPLWGLFEFGLKVMGLAARKRQPAR